MLFRFGAIVLVVIFCQLQIVSANWVGLNPLLNWEGKLKNMSHKMSAFAPFSATTNPTVPATEVVNGPIPIADRKFIIHGWRWHTMSVLKDLDRFSNMVASKPTVGRLSDGYDFVVKFNLGALIRVEQQIFLPWMKKLLAGKKHYLRYLDDVERHHRNMLQLSKEIANIIATGSVTPKSNERGSSLVGSSSTFGMASIPIARTNTLASASKQEVFGKNVKIANKELQNLDGIIMQMKSSVLKVQLLQVNEVNS